MNAWPILYVQYKIIVQIILHFYVKGNKLLFTYMAPHSFCSLTQRCLQFYILPPFFQMHLFIQQTHRL